MMLLRSPDAIRGRTARRLTNSPDFIRATGSPAPGRSGLDRDPGAGPRPLLRAAEIGWVGWMTLFSSTIAIGGWIKRHSPYGLLRSPDAIRERPSRRLMNSPDCIRATGSRSVGCAVRTTQSVDGAHGLGGPAAPYGSGL